jgi:hypothetical protein
VYQNKQKEVIAWVVHELVIWVQISTKTCKVSLRGTQTCFLGAKWYKNAHMMKLGIATLEKECPNGCTFYR